MKLLLDTHALLWFYEGNAALSGVAKRAIEDPANDCYVSHATAWEVAIKMSLGKLQLQVPYDLLFTGVLEANGIKLLIPETRHYQLLLDLPFHHRDPFDRLLIAQTMAEGLILLCNDQAMANYGVPMLW